MYILGINAYHGDVSAALLKDGRLVAAVEEERFRRIKHWAGFPTESIRTVLAMAGITGREVGHVAISRDPKANLLRKGWYALSRRPDLKLVFDRVKNAQKVRDVHAPLAQALGVPRDDLPKVHFVEHHPAHLASAFFVSPFQDASCCAIDGFGDFVSTSMALGQGNRLDVLEKVYFPHSLGLMYTAVTQYLGFHGYGDEFKVMGLAPYGKPKYVEPISQLVRLTDDGLFELELDYFRHWNEGVEMEWDEGYPTLGRVFTPELEKLLGPARQPSDKLETMHEDMAHSLQVVFENCAFHVLNGLYERTKNPRLAIAGGCAMNSVANGKIRTNTPFTHLYVQPASADNGTALGAAYWVWNQELKGSRGFVMEHGYWGPSHTEEEVFPILEKRDDEQWEYEVEHFDSPDETARATAKAIADGNVVGWYQGRMEWGARALGNRSIVADPRRADMRELINTKIKFREKFRPFAPSVALEALDQYFEGAVHDPFMLQVYPVREEKRAVIPAVTHVDGSGRLQTVSPTTNPKYYRLIKEFEKLTGVPIVLNTSFNENEPIVETPAQALDCFLRTRMDVIVLNDTMIRRVPAAKATAVR
ncbi:MAG TPA: carbamoyltransferase C-terminal domain-containing protein [Gemmatimonadaceae bacterium]